MATLHYEKITPNATAPAHQFDGTFEVYADRSYTVPVNDSARITTGLRILAPPGTTVRTVAIQASWSHNVFPDSFCSVNFPAEILNKKGQVKPVELIVLVRNMGMTAYEIKPNQAIARLEFVPILQIKSLETLDINSVAVKPTTLQVGESESTDHNNVRTWFIKKYTENPDSVKQWIKDNIAVELQKYKDSAAYAGIKQETRPRLEANLILRHMAPDVLTALRREFDIVTDGEKIVKDMVPNGATTVATPKKDEIDYGDEEEEVPVPKAKPQAVAKGKAVAKAPAVSPPKVLGKAKAKAKPVPKPVSPELSEGEEVDEDDE